MVVLYKRLFGLNYNCFQKQKNIHLKTVFNGKYRPAAASPFLPSEQLSNVYQPSEIEWKKLNQKGEQPSARSGHTLTWVGGKNYMLYGGIEETVDTHNKDGGPQRKIGPNEDIYFMKLVNSK